MPEYLFSYGTLQKEKVQVELFGRVLAGSSDILHGYKVAAVEIKDPGFLARGEDKHQFTAVPSSNPDDRIKGTVFEITEEELFHADSYEPVIYKRIKVKMASGKEAWVYLIS